MRRLTARTLDGSSCSILVVDDAVPLKRLLAGMLAEQMESAPLGKVSITALPAKLQREKSNYDLVLARVPHLLANWSFRAGFLRLPYLVDMRVRADEVAKRRQLGRSKTVGRAHMRWRQHGFSATQRSGPADLKLFYDTMYQPFISARYGDAAAVLDYSAMQRALQHGALVWIEQDGRPVAAQLVEQCGSTLHLIAGGTSLEPVAARTAGVLAALMVAGTDFAITNGFEWINLGGCMPWITDGVLQNKREWGAELVHRQMLHRGLVAGWSRWTPAVASLLSLAPICRHENTTFSVVTSTPRSHLPPHKLILPGVERLLVVDESPSAERSIPAQSPAITFVKPGSTADLLAEAPLRSHRPTEAESLASARSVPG